jgi:hypothetical protein
MFLVAIGILVVCSVPIAGGRLTKLGDVELRGVPCIVGSLAVQVLIVTILPGGDPTLHRLLHVASYLLAGLFLFLNRRLPGLPLVALGALANAIAIFANNGVMPATAAALRAAGEPITTGTYTNSNVVAHARLPFLGDIFAIPKPLPLHNVFSIGDVCITLGVVIAVHTLCGSRIARRFTRRKGAGARRLDVTRSG